jgi:hypothetical protein
MFSLFKKPQAAPPPQEAISRLKNTLETLEKREAYLEKRAQAEMDAARKLVHQKNKRGRSSLSLSPPFNKHTNNTC